MAGHFEAAIRDHLELSASLEALVPRVEAIAETTVAALERGGRVLVCGNGGSAAQSQHLAGELVGRFERERSGLPAVALTADVASLTAIANDFGYDRVFARQVAALGCPGDVLFGLSTSGTSRNVVEAIRRAGESGISTVGLTGSPGGEVADLADMSVVVPSTDTARVQEIHLIVIHAVCASVDSAFEAGMEGEEAGAAS